MHGLTKQKGSRGAVYLDHDEPNKSNPIEEIDLNRISNLILSKSKKKKDDYAIVRAIVDMIVSQQMPEKIRNRMIDNVNLFHGRWPSLNAKGLNVAMNIEGYGELKYGRQKVNHTPLPDKVAQSALSSMMNRNMNYTVRDYCRNAIKQKKDAGLALIKQRLSDLHFKPALDEATRRVQAKMEGREIDEAQLNSAQQEIQQIATELIGPEIDRAIKSTKVPTEKLMNRILEIAEKKTDLNHELEKGSTYVISCGMEFYRRRFGHNKVDIESIVPYDAMWCMSNNSDFVEDGLWFKYDRWLTPIEIVTEFFHIFGNKELKELEAYMGEIPSSHYDSRHADIVVADGNNKVFDILHESYGRVSDTGEFEPGEVVQDGDRVWAKSVFDGLSEFYNNKKGLKVTYCTWRWLKAGKKVWRKKMIGNEERVVELIRGEHYKLNRRRGDLRSRKIAIPETYECTVAADMYFDIGPVKGQIECNQDIDKPKLGVFGAVYNSMGGTIKNVSMMDLMKPFSFRINVLNDVLMDHIVNDLGTALVVDEETLMNKKGGPQAFMNLLHKFKIIVRNSKGKKSNNQDIYTTNLGNNAEISKYLSLISHYESKLIEAGSTNEGDFNSLGQYANQANVNASLANADRRKYSLFAQNRRVRERLYNALMWGAFYAYRDNEDIKDCFLGDELKAHYDENFYEIAGSLVRAEIDQTNEKRNNLDLLKQQLIGFVNHGGKVSELAGIVSAETMGQLMDIAENIERKNALEQQRAQQVQIDGQIQLADKNAALQTEIEDRKDKRQAKTDDNALKSAYIRSLFMANGADVNEDGQADFLTNNREERELKNQHRLLEHEEKKEKLAIERDKIKN